jgi:hypothetical protein
VVISIVLAIVLPMLAIGVATSTANDILGGYY